MTRCPYKSQIRVRSLVSCCFFILFKIFDNKKLIGDLLNQRRDFQLREFINILSAWKSSIKFDKSNPQGTKPDFSSILEKSGFFISQNSLIIWLFQLSPDLSQSLDNAKFLYHIPNRRGILHFGKFAFGIVSRNSVQILNYWIC